MSKIIPEKDNDKKIEGKRPLDNEELELIYGGERPDFGDIQPKTPTSQA